MNFTDIFFLVYGFSYILGIFLILVFENIHFNRSDVILIERRRRKPKFHVACNTYLNIADETVIVVKGRAYIGDDVLASLPNGSLRLFTISGPVMYSRSEKDSRFCVFIEGVV